MILNLQLGHQQTHLLQISKTRIILSHSSFLETVRLMVEVCQFQLNTFISANKLTVQNIGKLSQSSMTFEQIAQTILSKVLVPSNVSFTSYFPSHDKLRKLFLIYAPAVQDQIKNMTQKQMSQFVVAFILFKEAWKESDKKNIEEIRMNLERVVGWKSKMLDSKKGSFYKDQIIVHQDHLITLLGQMIESDKSLKLRPIRYDLIEIEADSSSLVIL